MRGLLFWAVTPPVSQSDQEIMEPPVDPLNISLAF